MNAYGIFIAAFHAARRYLVLMILLLTLGSSVVTTITRGMGPMPQLPPVGFVAERGLVVIQWHRGSIDAPIRLQVSHTPDFEAPLLDQTVSGITFNFQQELTRGRRYYWRVTQNDYTSPVSHFVVSPYHVKL